MFFQNFVFEISVKTFLKSGLLPPGALKSGKHSEIDLFRGTAVTQENQEREEPPTQVVKRVKFGKKSAPETCVFSPDGNYLATGTSDGYIEIWDYVTGKLRTDLDYQGKENFMVHEVGVGDFFFFSKSVFFCVFQILKRIDFSSVF